MVCTCSCGKEYGFEPIGYWFCPKCWSLNDSGRISSVVPEDVMEPDEAERMLRSNTDFKAEADSSVRANIHSWKAWYAYGLAYAAYTNLPQASICWTVAITLTDTDEETRSLADRTARMFVEMMTIFRVGGVRFPLPYLSSIEYHVHHRIPEYGSYSDRLADSLLQASENLDMDWRFTLVNLSSLIRFESMKVNTDLRFHLDCCRRIVDVADDFCRRTQSSPRHLEYLSAKQSRQLTLWLTMPYRVVMNDAGRVISQTSGTEISRLASVQPDDGSAGFIDHLMRAVRLGGELAMMRYGGRRNEERINELEDIVFDEIRLYLDQYIAGDPTTVPENRVYLESTLNPTLTS